MYVGQVVVGELEGKVMEWNSKNMNLKEGSQNHVWFYIMRSSSYYKISYFCGFFVFVFFEIELYKIVLAELDVMW